MDLDLFDYNLPEKNIALYPKEKGASRLLVCFKDKGNTIDELFLNIPDYLEKNSLLVLNNSKVYNARVYFNFQDGKRGEILILKYKDNEMECLIKPAKKVLKEKKIKFSEEIETSLIEKKEENTFYIRLNMPVEKLIEEKGVPPLPPYIKRQVKEDDKIWYQTIYASKTGSIAAPTAGLHFNEEILNRLKEKNIKILYLTLHVGIGTFKPIRKDKIEEHKMEEEYFEISEKLAEEIEKAKLEKRKIIAVGTTTT
ncbi:MAG: S-adenosylmethionine:tRNA ribosyltransferase-isomerase, partial [Thermoanaerobaculia bacterium]